MQTMNAPVFNPNPNELTIIAKIEAHGRLQVVGLHRLKGSRYALATCLVHPEAGSQLVRADNAARAQGAACCGSASDSKKSDVTYARSRIDRAIFDENKFIVWIAKPDADDRTMARVRVRGAILGVPVRVEAEQKNLGKSLDGVKKKIKKILDHHGEHLKLRVEPGISGRAAFRARCTVTGNELQGFSKIMRSPSRRSDSVRARLAPTKREPDLSVFLARASGPHELVRRLIREIAGPLAPYNEQAFAGLYGDARYLRFDMFYPGLGREPGVVIEVQSTIHEREIKKFGGAEAFEKRAKYDNKKVTFCLDDGKPQLICIRGDRPEPKVREELTKALRTLGILLP